MWLCGARVAPAFPAALQSSTCPIGQSSETKPAERFKIGHKGSARGGKSSPAHGAVTGTGAGLLGAGPWTLAVAISRPGHETAGALPRCQIRGPPARRVLLTTSNLPYRLPKSFTFQLPAGAGTKIIPSVNNNDDDNNDNNQVASRPASQPPFALAPSWDRERDPAEALLIKGSLDREHDSHVLAWRSPYAGKLGEPASQVTNTRFTTVHVQRTSDEHDERERAAQRPPRPAGHFGRQRA
ncbi:hypothetical protein GGR56DRAFT_362068 [Xylariaceae sp. FL0804]|nr:hypothetical protein GGR56DRAFT_362068 [Xylariaceae sp. FL0804]